MNGDEMVNISEEEFSNIISLVEEAVIERSTMLDRESRLEGALKLTLAWIDAVPKDTILPAMPGFDRDYVDYLLIKKT